jgi:predicted DCC family thiol-disulfide oxidoreductase YuxK
VVGGTSKATLFYDADCVLCRWTAAKVGAWDRRGRVRLVPLQNGAESDRLLGPMDRERRMASWHLVTCEGDVRSAGRGFAPLLRLLPGGAPLAWLAARAQPLTDALYVLVARHRSALGRLLTQGARRRADEALRRRKA